MAKSYPDLQMTGTWQDVAAGGNYAAIANQRVTLQSKGSVAIIYIGGAVAPADDSGVVLSTRQSVTGTSDHFWVKGSGLLAVLVED